MGILKAGEPHHWHKADATKNASVWSHNMTDPRTIDGWREEYWSADEKAFVRHLQEHEVLRTKPRRTSSDSEPVSAIFDLLESREKETEKLRLLIVAIRQKELAEEGAGEPEVDPARLEQALEFLKQGRDGSPPTPFLEERSAETTQKYIDMDRSEEGK